MRDLRQLDGYNFVRARAFANPWDMDRVSLFLSHYHSGKPHRGVAVLTFDYNMPEGQPMEPTCTLAREEAQELMDSLWAAGLRPQEAAGSTGQLEAMRQHLQDMRALAFTALEIDKP